MIPFMATSCPAMTPIHEITMIKAKSFSAPPPTILPAISGRVMASIFLTLFEIIKAWSISPIPPKASHHIPGKPIL